MAPSNRSVFRKTWQTLSSIKTGVILIILVVIFSAAGTVILQRPITDPDDIQRAYSPEMLRFLDAVGLTDVFHARWFVALMILVSLSIIAASVERFPNAWRYFVRPYKSPDDNFRRVLPNQAYIPVLSDSEGLAAAEKAFKHFGWKSEHIVHTNSFSLFTERHRLSEMAVYIVHASLLLIFLGGIVDALYGWKGFLMLTPGNQSSQIELRNGSIKTVPFAIRCDAAGEETYPDGSPKKYWSRLAVVDHGKEVSRKEIVVNDPLVYHGVRFYQASYGRTGTLDKLILSVSPKDGKGETREIALSSDQAVPLDADNKIQLAEFIPDYVVEDGHVYKRSNEVVNPAAHLVLTSAKSEKVINIWFPEIPGIAENESAPYLFQPKDLKTGVFTGLEVSHEPGQWAVWGGVILMAIGLTFVFYVVHIRFWVVPVVNEEGQTVLWVGGTANRNRDAFEVTFKRVVDQIRNEFKLEFVVADKKSAEHSQTSVAGK